jgi:O-antigen/teichoic acid export membrane protein
MRKLKWLLQSEGVQQTSVMVVGNTLATGLSAVSLIIISRLLGPALFGEFSLGFAIVMILIRLADMGLNAAILKYAGGTTDRKEVNTYFGLSLSYRIILAITFILLGLVFEKPLLDFFDLSYPSVLRISLILGFFVAMYEQLQAQLQAIQAFKQVVIVNAIQASAKLIGAAAFWFWQMKSLSFMYVWYTAAPIIPLLFSRWFHPSWVKLKFQLTAAPYHTQLINLSKHLAVSYVAAGIVDQISIIFVQGYLNSYETGLLGGVSRIALLFTLAAGSLSQVLFPRVARYQAKHDIYPYLKKAVGLSLLIIASFVLLIPLTPYLIQFTIGPEYLAGSSLLLVLLAATLVHMASIPFIALFYSFDAPWYFSFSGLAQLFVTILGSIVLIPSYGLWGSAITSLLSRLVILLITGLMATYYLQTQLARKAS